MHVPLTEVILTHEGAKLARATLPPGEYVGSTIRSVEFLRGRTVKTVELSACENLTDITPLKDCTQLESLSFPRTARDIEFLRRMPSLKRLCISYPLILAAEFWKEYDALKAAGQKGGEPILRFQAGPVASCRDCARPSRTVSRTARWGFHSAWRGTDAPLSHA